MLITRTVRHVVEFCSRHAWAVVVTALLFALASTVYATTHFAITTDVNKLISPDIGWRQREIGYEQAFPGPFTSILVVVDAPTTELGKAAAAALAKRLSEEPKLFHGVRQYDGDPFFAKNALLFQPADDLEKMTMGLSRAGPIIGALVGDPSLRGLTRGLAFGLLGVQTNRATLEDLGRGLIMSANTVEQVLAGKPATFSWQVMLSGKLPEAKDLRHFIEVLPVLNYAALEPGREASNAILKAVSDLKLGSIYQARVRMTGPVAMADDEFGTVKDGAVFNTIATIVIVLFILWMALHSPRIIVAVFLNLFVGLAITAAVGLWMVDALNLISIAFAVLFVGLGVDFGIQFAVRYRSERFKAGELQPALFSAADKIGAPLTLAAAAVAAGFLAFWPTEYRGVSELGKVAGVGMLIAYATSVTVLPALLTLLKPPGEAEKVGYAAFAPIDRFIQRHRIAVIGGTILVALAGVPLLFHLHFDFNPINLRSSAVKSVATFLDLRTDPNVGVNSINVIVPNADAIDAVADKLRKIPEVDHVMSVKDLVPADQDRKLGLIKGLTRQLQTPLQTEEVAPPTDQQNHRGVEGVGGLSSSKLAAKATGRGAESPITLRRV